MMSNSFEWAKGLRVSDHDLESWKNSASPNELLISWCIKNHKIDANEYLKWARNFYSIPSLASAYFASAPNLKFYESLASMPFWSKDLIPLCEWDGVLFIACPQPLPDAPWSFPVQFILASPTDLELAWTRLNKSSSSQNADAHLENLTKTHSSAQSNTPISVDAGIPQPLPNETAKVSNQEAPAGLTIPDFPELPDLPDVTQTNTSASKQTSESALASEPEMPEGLSVGISFKLPEPKQEESLLAFPLEPTTPPKNTPLALNPVITENGLSNQNATEDNNALPIAPKAPVQSSLPKLANDEEIHRQFANLADVFNSMQLFELVAETGKLGKLKVTAYTGAWAPKAEAESTFIYLDDPSIFRIVVRTKLPYHGYVVPNEANEKFFQLWGINEWPEHVTLTPIKEGKNVLGLLLGIGSKASNTAETLKRSEESSRVLVQCFVKKTTKAA